MKLFKNLAILITISIAASAMAQEIARPRSTVDLTRTERLTGTPWNSQAATPCPTGQVLSGGSCVLISNQNALSASWTSFFLGETKCASFRGNTPCAKVNSDGTITFSINGVVVGTSTVPSNYTRLSVATSALDCSAGLGDLYSARPLASNTQMMRGDQPGTWEFTFGQGQGLPGPGGCN